MLITISQIVQYSLLIVAIVSHYWLGKALRLSGFFTCCLAGLTITAFGVGALANFYAGLIQPYIWISLCIVGILSLREGLIYFKDFFILFSTERFLSRWMVQKQIWILGKMIKEKWKLTAVLLFLGLLFFSLNYPNYVFFRLDSANRLLVSENNDLYGHATLPFEMLEADYLSRLRIWHLYPKEFSKYHFFNGGIHATILSLVSMPNLMSYYMSMTLLLIFILLSFAEQFFKYFGINRWNFIFFISWIIIGFSIFWNALGWSFRTTGPLSVFAYFHVLMSLTRGRFKDTLIFTMILGASASRLMPIAALSGILALSMYLKESDSIRVGINRLCISRIDVWSMCCFGIYNFLTFTGGGTTIMSFFSSHIFNTDWLYVLSTYKLFGFLGWFAKWDPNPFYNDHNFGSFFVRIYNNQDLGAHIIFVLTLLAGVVIILSSIIKKFRIVSFQDRKTILSFTFCSIIFITLLYLKYWDSNQHINLGAMFLLYFVFFGILAFFTYKGEVLKRILIFQGLLMIATLFYLFTGVNAIKGPVAFIIWDVGIWIFIGFFIFNCSSLKSKKTVLAWTLITCIFFRMGLHGTLNSAPWGHGPLNGDPWGQRVSAEAYPHNIDITEVTSSNLIRTDWVDENNMCKFYFNNFHKNNLFPVVLGCRLAYSPKYKSFGFSPFVAK